MSQTGNDPLDLMGDRLLTSMQAAQFLGMSEGTLRNRRMIEGGGPPFTEIRANSAEKTNLAQ